MPQIPTFPQFSGKPTGASRLLSNQSVEFALSFGYEPSMPYNSLRCAHLSFLSFYSVRPYQVFVLTTKDQHPDTSPLYTQDL